MRNGLIGKVQTITIGLPNNGQTALEWGLTRPTEEEPPDGFDYDMWLGPAPWRPYNSERVSGNYGGGWRYYRDYSGGMMTDWGAHHFDIAQWALGMDNSGPTEVYAPGTGDYERLTYKYANGTEMSLGQNGFPNGVLFKGEDGEIFCDRGKVTPDNLRAYQPAPAGSGCKSWARPLRTIGSNASKPARSQFVTWKLEIARRPFVIWAISLSGRGVRLSGTRTPKKSSATLMPRVGWIAPIARRGIFKCRFSIERETRKCNNLTRPANYRMDFGMWASTPIRLPPKGKSYA